MSPARPVSTSTQSRIIDVPPAEAEIRQRFAIYLLSTKGIDEATLSVEQFNVFANQRPDLQAASLDMIAKYGAERLRVVHPIKDEDDSHGKNKHEDTDDEDDKDDEVEGEEDEDEYEVAGYEYDYEENECEEEDYEHEWYLNDKGDDNGEGDFKDEDEMEKRDPGHLDEYLGYNDHEGLPCLDFFTGRLG